MGGLKRKRERVGCKESIESIESIEVSKGTAETGEIGETAETALLARLNRVAYAGFLLQDLDFYRSVKARKAP